MPRLFISYRRADSKAVSGRIYDRLVTAFGKKAIFKDIDNIPPGTDFRQVLRDATAECRVMLVVIGPQWLTVTDAQGKRRLDDPDDFVRIEVESGLLRKEVTVIPLLVEGAQMPTAAQLPASLRQLTFNNAFTLHDDPLFNRDVVTLIGLLRPLMRVRNTSLPLIVGGVTALLLMVVAVIVLSSPDRLNTGTGTPTTTPPQIAAQSTATLDVVQIAAQTQAREAEQTRQAIPTATPTPTEDVPATVNAINTGTRAYVQTQDALRLAQATVDAAATLTARPTQTPIPPTPIPPTPTTDPLSLARTPVTSNWAWTPISQAFDGVTMVLVPAGCFLMGSTDGQSDEAPVHEQCFPAPFWIDQTEVTQADFERLGGVKAVPNTFDGDARPVEEITWVEALDFCEARAMRLPTEAEWEYAARGPDGWVYPWGDDWNADNVVWSGNSNNQTSDVGSRPAGASWVGALDMSGNVFEWVSSLYQAYPYDAQDGREDNANRTDGRVLRGGSWYSYGPTVLRAANRVRVAPDDSNGSVGVRCALS